MLAPRLKRLSNIKMSYSDYRILTLLLLEEFDSVLQYPGAGVFLKKHIFQHLDPARMLRAGIEEFSHNVRIDEVTTEYFRHRHTVQCRFTMVPKDDTGQIAPFTIRIIVLPDDKMKE